jgi:hypothetical protein
MEPNKLYTPCALLVEPIKDSMGVRLEMFTTERHQSSSDRAGLCRGTRKITENEIIKKLFLVSRRRRTNISV